MTGALRGVARLLLAVVPLMPALVRASGGEGHGPVESHGIPWNTLLLSAINFGIFVYFIVVRGILPALRRWALERRDRVVREIEEARCVREEAERLRAEWEQRMATVEAEIADIRAQATAEARQERERILEAARATAAAIEADAQRAVAQEIRRAHDQLREEVARAAIAGAERLIREQVSPDDQQRFVDDFLRQVPS